MLKKNNTKPPKKPKKIFSFSPPIQKSNIIFNYFQSFFNDYILTQIKIFVKPRILIANKSYF